MSDSIRNPSGPGAGEDKLPAAFRRKPVASEDTSSEPTSSASFHRVPRRGAFEQMLGEELGSVKNEPSGRRPGEAPIENLLIARNLGALYKSFLNLED